VIATLLALAGGSPYVIHLPGEKRKGGSFSRQGKKEVLNVLILRDDHPSI